MAKPNVGTSFNCVVGAVVQHHRKEKRATQEELAKALGLTQSAYSRLERGVTAFSVPQLKRVAQALRLSPAELLQVALLAQDELCAHGVPVVDELPEPDGTPWLSVSSASLHTLIASVLVRGRRGRGVSSSAKH